MPTPGCFVILSFCCSVVNLDSPKSAITARPLLCRRTLCEFLANTNGKILKGIRILKTAQDLYE